MQRVRALHPLLRARRKAGRLAWRSTKSSGLRSARHTPGMRRCCRSWARRSRGGCVLPRGRTPRRPRGATPPPSCSARWARSGRPAGSGSGRHGDRPRRRRRPGRRGATTGAHRAVRPYRGDPNWKRHADGGWRATPFGSEAITLGTTIPSTSSPSTAASVPDLGVDARDELTPRLLPDGGIGFVDPATHRVSDLTIAPVAIFDSAGADVTRLGVALGARQGNDPRVGLEDDGLPEPYVIDPPSARSEQWQPRRPPRSRRPCRPESSSATSSCTSSPRPRRPRRSTSPRPQAGRSSGPTRARRTSNCGRSSSRRPRRSPPPTHSHSRTHSAATSTRRPAQSSRLLGDQVLRPDRRHGRQQQRRRDQARRPTYRACRQPAPTGSRSGPSPTAARDNDEPDDQRRRDDGADRQRRGPAVAGAGRRRRAGGLRARDRRNGNVLSGNARWAAQVFSLIPDTTAPAQTLAVNEVTNPGGQSSTRRRTRSTTTPVRAATSRSAPLRPMLTRASPPSLSMPSH